MNKKAVMVITLMVVGVVIAFIAFSVVNLSDDLAGKSVSYIGAKELTIARLQMRSQEDLLFVDQSARLAAYKSVFNLADLGGFRASSPCGVYDNYNLWNNKTDKCYPTKTELGEALVNDFRFNFNQYRSLLQKRNLLASYTYFYKDGDIIGVADTNFIYDKPVKDFILSVNPSFREKIDFDFDVFNGLQEFIVSIDKCPELQQASISQCVQTRMTQFTMKYTNINMTYDDCKGTDVKIPDDFDTKGVLKFCAIVQDKKYPLYNADLKVAGLNHPLIRFAVTI